VSWQQLVDIVREGVAEAAAEQTEPPTACPNDGEPLRTGPDGGLYCAWDGWRPGDRYVGDQLR
jgi:hypothetical protein